MFRFFTPKPKTPQKITLLGPLRRRYKRIHAVRARFVKKNRKSSVRQIMQNQSASAGKVQYHRVHVAQLFGLAVKSHV
jgi:hypothetical protein